MAVFDDALARLPEPLRARIQGCLAAWGDDVEWRQVADNLTRECALATHSFETLLSAFAEGLADDSDPHVAWRAACKPYEFHGAEVPDAVRPTTLGRAASIGRLAYSMSQATELDPATARRDLEDYLGSAAPPRHFQANLQATPLGDSLMWATFDPEDMARDPFLGLPATAAAVRCALGLGSRNEGELIVALTYSADVPERIHPLHRPTVADANSYPYYRPHADPCAAWGYTLPLTPNPEALPPMPEIVHRQVTGVALLQHRLLR